MTELDKILLTSATTIVGGIFVYSIGRIIEKFLIEPLYEYRKTIGLITDNSIFYANTYSNPTVSSKEDKDEASKTLRRLSSELTSRMYLIPFYKCFSLFKIIPNYSSSINASSSLIGLSNALYNNDYTNIENKINNIEICLNIKT